MTRTDIRQSSRAFIEYRTMLPSLLWSDYTVVEERRIKEHTGAALHRQCKSLDSAAIKERKRESEVW